MRVPPCRVPPEFHQRNSARAAGWSGAALRFHRFLQSSARFHKGSRNVLQGFVVCPGGKQCVVRPPSEKPSEQ